MKRPPKPRITKPRLRWQWRPVAGVWEPQHRITWHENGKRKERAIRLDWGGDPAELDRLYWACETNRHEKQQAPAKYTWGELVKEWRADPRIQGRIAPGTKKSYRREMDALLANNRDKDVRRTTRGGLRVVHTAMAETPRKADWRVQIVSLLWNYAKTKLDWPIGDNPATGLDKYGTQRPFEPWPDWMIEKLPEAPDAVQCAAELILGTGQRPSAAIGMKRSQFRGEWMTVTDEKGATEFEVFCPERLAAFVVEWPAQGAHLIARNLTEPMGYDAVERAFRRWRKGLGEPAKQYTLHGLRKLAIIQLAESGATDAEIQAITNQSPETIAYYRKMANRKVLSRNAQKRRK